ncbi:MAG: hypothetical protein R3E39_15010 [Anaerolineae bacterium]
MMKAKMQMKWWKRMFDQLVMLLMAHGLGISPLEATNLFGSTD